MEDHSTFLRAISQVESSGGKNMDHAVNTSGLDKGMKAVGKYGITPSTFDTLINSRGKGGYGPDENIMGQLDNEQLKDFIEHNPRVDDSYAGQNADRLLKRSGGDEDKAAVMWNKGANVDESELQPEALEQNPYVQKFRKVKSMLGTKHGR